MARRHGRRRGVAQGCDCRAKGMCFTTWDAANAAVSRVPDAERAYRGTCCGHLHITRSTQDEFAQRVAEFACTHDDNRGIVDLGQETEADHESSAAGAEPRGDEGGLGTPPFERSAQARLAPSPATLARRLASRSAS